MIDRWLRRVFPPLPMPTLRQRLWWWLRYWWWAIHIGALHEVDPTPLIRELESYGWWR